MIRLIPNDRNRSGSPVPIGLILAVLITAVPFISKAQPSDTVRRYPKTMIGTEISLAVGVQVNNISNLNRELRAAGIDPLHTSMFNFGFGPAIRYRELILGLEAGFLEGSQQNVMASGFNSCIYLSTNILAVKRCIFSPRVGINWQETHLQITQPGSATSFSNALTTSNNQVELVNESTALDLGLVFKIHRLRGLRHNPIVETGYRIGLGESTWNVRNSSVSDGPRDKVSNFYFNLLLGMGR